MRIFSSFKHIKIALRRFWLLPVILQLALTIKVSGQTNQSVYTDLDESEKNALQNSLTLNKTEGFETAYSYVLQNQVMSIDRRREVLLNLYELIEDPEQVGILDLSNLGLKELPTFVHKYSNIHELILSNNDISELPKLLQTFPNLTHLDVSGNKLGTKDFKSSKLKGVRSLDISDNSFADLPQWMNKMKGITHLKIGNNSFNQVPKKSESNDI